MRKTLAKNCFMYYPFAQHFRFALGHLLLAFSFVSVFALIPLHTVCAQSDEKAAADFRARAVQAQDRGNIKEALFYYMQASAMIPDDASLKNDVGLMQDALGQDTEAEENYRKAIALNPDYLPAYFNMGRFYAKKGLYPLAAKYLKERIARGSPDDPWTLQAQEELEAVYDSLPELQAEHLKEQATALDDMISQGKKRLEKRVVKDTTTSFEAAYQDGVAAFVDKRFDEAVVSLETAVVLNPRSVDARHALQRARLERDRTYLQDEAREYRDKLKGRVLESYLGPDPSGDVPVARKETPWVQKVDPSRRISSSLDQPNSAQNKDTAVNAAFDQVVETLPPSTRE